MQCRFYQTGVLNVRNCCPQCSVLAKIGALLAYDSLIKCHGQAYVDQGAAIV